MFRSGQATCNLSFGPVRPVQEISRVNTLWSGHYTLNLVTVQTPGFSTAAAERIVPELPGSDDLKDISFISQLVGKWRKGRRQLDRSNGGLVEDTFSGGSQHINPFDAPIR